MKTEQYKGLLNRMSWQELRKEAEKQYQRNRVSVAALIVSAATLLTVVIHLILA